MTSTDAIEEMQTMIISGKKFEVITSKIAERKWQLSVENELGIRSVWHELFKSPEKALEIGRKAIESEGVDSFMGEEDFGYLFED